MEGRLASGGGGARADITAATDGEGEAEGAASRGASPIYIACKSMIDVLQLDKANRKLQAEMQANVRARDAADEEAGKLLDLLEEVRRCIHLRRRLLTVLRVGYCEMG